MNIDEMLEISDCPLCEGGALLEEECGCSYYVMCLECGCHTVNIDFRSEQERLDIDEETLKKVIHEITMLNPKDRKSTRLNSSHPK